MCTWMSAAPAAWHALAVETSSSRLQGSAGTSAFADSAPVGATVMSVLVTCSSCHGYDVTFGASSHEAERVDDDVLLARHRLQRDRSDALRHRRRHVREQPLSRFRAGE